MELTPVKTVPNKLSTDQEWMNWYRALKGRYGLDPAIDLFLYAFRKRASSEANSVQLRKFAQSEGFSIDGGILGGISDTLTGAGEFMQGVLGKISGTGKIILWVVIAVVLIIAIGIARKPEAFTSFIKPKTL